MAKRKKLLTEQSNIPDTDLTWGESLDAAMFTAIVQRLSTPIRNLPAFKMGLINMQGKIIKNPKSRYERRALSYLDQLALFMRQTMGGRTVALYNLYRKARLSPSFMQSIARSQSFRFLKYYDLRMAVYDKPTPEPITGGTGVSPTSMERPLG